MHRELTSFERPFQAESHLGLFAFTAIVAGFVGLDLWPSLTSWASTEWGIGLPSFGPGVSFLNYTFSFATLAAILGGARTLVSVAESLRAGRLGADVALAIAIIAALAIQQPMVAAEVVLIGLVGECLEAYTFGRTQHAIRRLVETVPRMCLVRRGGQEVKVAIDQVAPGEQVITLPGKRVPVDGIVIEGRSAVDQSTLTGESLPVDKSAGDEVYAGTINQFGAIVIEARHVAAQTVMGRVIELTAQALKQKSNRERTADRWARLFLPIVLVLALATFALHYWLNRSQPTAYLAGLYPALAVLVVACPCALILATPATLMAAIARLARTGVLIKSSQGLEHLAETTLLVLDKTGTLTEGRLQLGDVISFHDGLNKDTLLRIAATAEQRSEHPVAVLFAEEARKRGLNLDSIRDFNAHPGAGVTARAGNQLLRVGNRRFLEEQGIPLSENAEGSLAKLDDAGQTPLFVALDDRLVGVIGVWDTIRPEAAAVLADLRRSGLTSFALLTGDRAAAARAVAERLEIHQVLAEQLPQQKAEFVRQQQAAGQHVAMIGDGVNDAPALAVAHVGLALGGMGSDIAAEAGDVVLMGDPLRPLPMLYRLSRKTVEILRQNMLWFAIGVNVAGILLTAWILPLWSAEAREQAPLWAAIYHQIGSLAVLLNAMRLLWFERSSESAWMKSLSGLGKRLDDGIEGFNLHDFSHWVEERWKALAASSGLLLALLYLATGITQIQPDAVGILSRCGRPLGGELAPGLHLHWPWPWETVTTVEPARLRGVEIGFRNLGQATEVAQTWSSPHTGLTLPDREESLMITGDGNLLEVQLILNYTIAHPKSYLFGSNDPQATLRVLGESVVRELLAQSDFMDVLTGRREEFQKSVMRRLQIRLAEPAYQRLGIRLEGVAFQDVHPPRELVEAYYEVTRAQSRKAQLITEAQRRAEDEISQEQVTQIRQRAVFEGRLDESRQLAMSRRDAFLALAAALKASEAARLFRYFPAAVGGVPSMLVGLSAAQPEQRPLTWRLFEFRQTVEMAEKLLEGRAKVLRDPALKGQLQIWPDAQKLRLPPLGREREAPADAKIPPENP